MTKQELLQEAVQDWILRLDSRGPVERQREYLRDLIALSYQAGKNAAVDYIEEHWFMTESKESPKEDFNELERVLKQARLPD